MDRIDSDMVESIQDAMAEGPEVLLELMSYFSYMAMYTGVENALTRLKSDPPGSLEGVYMVLKEDMNMYFSVLQKMRGAGEDG